MKSAKVVSCLFLAALSSNGAVVLAASLALSPDAVNHTIPNGALSQNAAKPAPPEFVAMGLPDTLPLPPPAYMRDNQHNYWGTAPDKGSLNDPVTTPHQSTNHSNPLPLEARAAGYWIDGFSSSTKVGQMPYAPSGYHFYRNVKSYGAKGDGVTDDTAAINRAVTDGNRCGQKCGASSTLGALIYFPAGTYNISTPIIQYYYSQFVGDPNNRPVIRGAPGFKGIALIDTDVYIPGGSGTEWYINQNQFYRQIRNFVFDLTLMSNTNQDQGQQYVPTGIHWQVAQATSLQNCHFQMPQGGGTQAVGIFMENGSGGFVSDLSFFGGNIGFHAGSQQFTARGLSFRSCGKAIIHIWDWGFTWKNIDVFSCYVALSCSDFGGDSGQGTGSISVIDSNFESVPYAITVKQGGPDPNIVLDNLRVVNSPRVVMYDGTIIDLLNVPGTQVIQSWATGRRYTTINGTGSFVTGNINPAPSKPAALLDTNGTYFARSKPQYETLSSGSFINVIDHSVKNDGTGDQASAINTVLSKANGAVVFFPAGVYIVKSTVKVPAGARIVGAGWSQIMAAGSYFQDQKNPKVMVKVGNSGDKGIVEISDMLFTVQGPTAGAILVEWNIHESTKGSAGMWDCHFRVGGATGSQLQLANCPKSATSVNTNCMAASMLMHVTTKSSGYFENIWAWVADHDIDIGGCDGNSTSCSQIDVYAGRGILIESQGPTWLYGSASEHSVLYQYQLSGASNIYLGHMQTETPYFQPVPEANQPFTIGTFPQDPTFPLCTANSANSSCVEAWALRILNSTNVYIYSAGFYSFFSDYSLSCSSNGSENCQEHIFETGYSQGIWVYNLFTKGTMEVASPQGPIQPLLQLDNQDQFTTEISVWIPLALTGANLGGNSADSNTPNNVGIIPLPCTTVPPHSTFTMSAACTSGILALPSSGSGASSNNQPPGPAVCNERCDFYRLITGTCCGVGGSIGNPIIIPPGVTVPYDIPLPSGYVPNLNLIIPIPGQYDPNSIFGAGGGVVTTTSGGTTTTLFALPPGEIFTTATTTYVISYGSLTSTVTTTTQYPKFSHVTTYTTTDPNGKTKVATTTSADSSRYTDTNGDPCTPGACGCLPGSGPVESFLGGLSILVNIVIPGGYCNPKYPIIIPPGPLPPDPPCVGPTCRPCEAGPCGDTGTSEGSSTDPNKPPKDDCKPNLTTATGLCANGNFPVYDTTTGAINCDYDSATVPYVVSVCQQEADQNPSEVQSAVDHDNACCTAPANKRSLLERFDDLAKLYREKSPQPSDLVAERKVNETAWYEARAALELEKRAATRACPASSTYPPATQAGQCYATYTCNYDRFPNICANARSGIMERGKTSVLTYNYNVYDYHDVNGWSNGKALKGGRGEVTARKIREGLLQPRTGWGLVNCQIEEYPFGSGNPDRHPVTFQQHAVNRLVPQSENAEHGADLATFIRDQDLSGQKKEYNVHGLTYCVQFGGKSFTSGRTDDDYLLGDNQSRNPCGQAYGPGFLLANRFSRAINADTDPTIRNWDPWWDSRLFEHTISIARDGSSQVANLPSQYCNLPSPGMKSWDSGANSWANVVGGVTFGITAARRNDNVYRRCDDPVVYNGPRGTEGPTRPPAPPAVVRRGEDGEDQSDRQNKTLIKRTKEDSTWSALTNVTELMGAVQISSGAAPLMGLTARQVAGGSFLDPRVYGLLGCNNDDVDPCYTADCDDPGYPPIPADGFVGPVGGGGGHQTSTETPTPTSTTPPPRTFTAGIAIAGHTNCVAPAIGPCVYQWAVYDADPPQYTYPGCDTGSALYSTGVDVPPVYNAIPTLGPFDTHGLKGCVYANGALSCMPSAKCNSCPTLPNGDGICVGSNTKCDAGGGNAFTTEEYCQW